MVAVPRRMTGIEIDVRSVPRGDGRHRQSTKRSTTPLEKFETATSRPASRSGRGPGFASTSEEGGREHRWLVGWVVAFAAILAALVAGGWGLLASVGVEASSARTGKPQPTYSYVNGAAEDRAVSDDTPLIQRLSHAASGREFASEESLGDDPASRREPAGSDAARYGLPQDSSESRCRGNVRERISSAAVEGAFLSSTGFFRPALEWLARSSGVFPGAGHVRPEACEEASSADSRQPTGAGVEELLSHPNFEASPQAEGDLRAGIVDERLVVTLLAIVKEHQIYVNAFKTGHTFGSEFQEGPYIPVGYGNAGGHPNTHYFGRAADIWEVDGMPIFGCGSHPAVVDVGRILAAIPPQQRPDVIIGPSAWNGALGYPREAGWIPDNDQVARHEDHLHLGFYSDEGTSNTVTPAPGSRAKEVGECTEVPPEPKVDPPYEHPVGLPARLKMDAGLKKRSATSIPAEHVADDERRVGERPSAWNRQTAPLNLSGAVTHPERSTEQPRAQRPVSEQRDLKRTLHRKAKESQTGKVEPRNPVPEQPDTREPAPEPEKPGPKEPEPKPEEPGSRPALEPALNEPEEPEPDKPATKEPESERPEPETPKTQDNDPEGEECPAKDPQAEQSAPEASGPTEPEPQKPTPGAGPELEESTCERHAPKPKLEKSDLEGLRPNKSEAEKTESDKGGPAGLEELKPAEPSDSVEPSTEEA
jgi:hypothetical protein